MNKFTFTLTEEEANTILAALQELPAKIANPLSKTLIDQAQAQAGGAKNHEVNLSSGAETQESFA